VPIEEHPTLAVLVAVEEELRAIRKRVPRAESVSARGFAVWTGRLAGREVALAKSGMGGSRAHSAASALLERFPGGELLVCGFGAGLREGVAPGSVVVATGLLSATAVPSTCGPPGLEPCFSVSAGGRHALLTPAAGMLHTAEGLGSHRGLLLSVPRVVATAAEKARLGRRSGAAALDVESLGAANAARRAGARWLAVRAITDAVGDDLPLDFSAFEGPDGQVALGRLVPHVLTHPRLIPGFWMLGRRAALAAGNLARFVEEYAGASTRR
jgi:adenosylhomocysteine nucleosidase